MTTVIEPTKTITREQWLQHAVTVLRAEAAALGIVVPPVQVSCSWPGGGDSQKRIGECWSTKASKAKINEIFISPKIEDSAKVMSILAHELVHAVDNCEHGHTLPFVLIAKRLGLEGKPTQMGLDESRAAALAAIMTAQYGRFPHQILDKSKSPVKKQTTRMLKCVCLDEGCGAIWRMSRSMIEAAGKRGLSCPVCRTKNVTTQ